MNLKSFIERTNMSIAQLAELMGISVPAAYTWLSDKASPKYDAIKTLLLNGCRLEEIFDQQVLDAVRDTHRDDFPGMDLVLTPEKCKEIVKAGISLLKAQGNDPTLDIK